MSRRQPAKADRDAAAGDERVKEEDGSRALVVVLRVLGRLILGHSLNHRALRMPACPCTCPCLPFPLICRGLPYQSINRLINLHNSSGLSHHQSSTIQFHAHTEKMPHFPKPSQEVSETRALPTRERESEHSDSRRPQPPSTNDNNAQRTSRLRVQNRRRRYLALNSDYFSGSNLEQAGL
jgi:hypothetical protein